MIAANAEESLWALDEYSEDAAATAETLQGKLEAIGVAYVLHALENPGDFELMLGSTRTPLSSGGIPSEAPVFRVLLDVVAAFGLAEDEQLAAAISAWSLVHGLAVLLISGPLQPLAEDRTQVEQLARDITRRLKLQIQF